MINLTQEQKSFLDHHKIPISYIFDAQGLKRTEYHDVMKENEKSIAVNVTPCKKFGHAMRTRSGDCVQCRPASLTFLTRYNKDSFIYVAGSQSHKFLKIGIANNIKDREYFLNKSGYGGVSDWEIIYTFKCKNAGRVEYEIHKALEKYAIQRSFVKGGRNVDCLEIFTCGYITVKQAIINNTSNTTKESEWEKVEKTNYEFNDIVGDVLWRGNPNIKQSESCVAGNNPTIKSVILLSQQDNPGSSINPENAGHLHKIDSVESNNKIGSVNNVQRSMLNNYKYIIFIIAVIVACIFLWRLK